MDLPKSAVQVPGIKELRKQLGFPESLPRTKDLTRSIKVFRLRFTSPAGIKGSSCRDWKSEQHKEVLRCMTRAWLEDEQNGERFWPPAESPSVLQYALHPSTIRELVKQLFFKCNLQGHYTDRRVSKPRNPATAQSAAEDSGRNPPATARNINIDPPANATAQATAENRDQSSPVPDNSLGPEPRAILTVSGEPIKSRSSIKSDDCPASEHTPSSTIAKHIPDCHSDASLRQGFSSAVQGNSGPSSSSYYSEQAFIVIDSEDDSPVTHTNPSANNDHAVQEGTRPIIRRKKRKRLRGQAPSRHSSRPKRPFRVPNTATEEELDDAVATPVAESGADHEPLAGMSIAGNRAPYDLFPHDQQPPQSRDIYNAEPLDLLAQDLTYLSSEYIVSALGSSARCPTAVMSAPMEDQEYRQAQPSMNENAPVAASSSSASDEANIKICYFFVIRRGRYAQESKAEDWPLKREFADSTLLQIEEDITRAFGAGTSNISVSLQDITQGQSMAGGLEDEDSLLFMKSQFDQLVEQQLMRRNDPSMQLTFHLLLSADKADDTVANGRAFAGFRTR
jgi:hypothetical protein